VLLHHFRRSLMPIVQDCTRLHECIECLSHCLSLDLFQIPQHFPHKHTRTHTQPTHTHTRTHAHFQQHASPNAFVTSFRGFLRFFNAVYFSFTCVLFPKAAQAMLVVTRLARGVSVGGQSPGCHVLAISTAPKADRSDLSIFFICGP
jgi:hypothetical protein